MVQSASNISGCILRNFETREVGPMKELLKSLIRPRLDYCLILYNPPSISSKMKLETPIRAFIRKIRGFKEFDYWERIEELKIYSEERRRERYAIIHMYKIWMEFVPNPGIQWNENERTGIKAKIPERQREAPTYVKNLRENYFTTFAPKLFNCLPLEVRNFTTEGQNKIFSFKNNLDKYLAHIPDQPNVQGLQSRRAAQSNSIIDQILYRRPSKLLWSYCS